MYICERISLCIVCMYINIYYDVIWQYCICISTCSICILEPPFNTGTAVVSSGSPTLLLLIYLLPPLRTSPKLTGPAVHALPTVRARCGSWVGEVDYRVNMVMGWWPPAARHVNIYNKSYTHTIKYYNVSHCDDVSRASLTHAPLLFTGELWLLLVSDRCYWSHCREWLGPL